VAKGEVVGYYSVPINGNPNDFINHAFLFSRGKIQELISTFSFANDISNRGDITGGFLIRRQSPQDVFHAFLYTRGQLRDLGTLGGEYSAGWGINDRGQVVGESSLAGNSAEHAFLYSGGQMQDLGTLGGNSSVALRINEHGQIVGYSFVHVVLPPPLGSIYASRAFLYSGGRMIDLGALPGSIQSTANDINNKAEVVGLSYGMYPDAPLNRGFLYSGGTMLDINSLLVPGSGWIVLNAWAINDAGQIAAQGTRNGIGHGLLLNPVPAAKVP
jgi:probable HAF family extracellular repeat protein